MAAIRTSLVSYWKLMNQFSCISFLEFALNDVIIIASFILILLID